jgi:hypothetical protein
MPAPYGESISFEIPTPALAAELVAHLAPRWHGATEARGHAWAVVVPLATDEEPSILRLAVESWARGTALDRIPCLVAGQRYVIASVLSVRREGPA